MSIRDAVGDLCVTLKELSALPTPVSQRSMKASFSDWFAFGERFFHQAIDVGLEVEAAGRAATNPSPSPLSAVQRPSGSRK